MDSGSRCSFREILCGKSILLFKITIVAHRMNEVERRVDANEGIGKGVPVKEIACDNFCMI